MCAGGRRGIGIQNRFLSGTLDLLAQMLRKQPAHIVLLTLNVVLIMSNYFGFNLIWLVCLMRSESELRSPNFGLLLVAVRTVQTHSEDSTSTSPHSLPAPVIV